MGQPIQVDYAALETAEAEMKKIANAIQTEVQDLTGKLGHLDWEGADKTAYDEKQHAMNQSIQDIQELLQQIAGAVGTARDNYMATEKANAQTWA